MKRRNFLTKSVVAASAYTLATSSVFASQPEKKKTKIKCKLTVVKKQYYEDLYVEIRGKKFKPCPKFEIGQEVIINKWWECPDGFCEWAWADMRPFIQQIFAGKEKTCACCSDGFRPVSFKLERIEEVVES